MLLLYLASKKFYKIHKNQNRFVMSKRNLSQHYAAVCIVYLNKILQSCFSVRPESAQIRLLKLVMTWTCEC